MTNYNSQLSQGTVTDTNTKVAQFKMTADSLLLYMLYGRRRHVSAWCTGHHQVINVPQNIKRIFTLPNTQLSYTDVNQLSRRDQLILLTTIHASFPFRLTAVCTVLSDSLSRVIFVDFALTAWPKSTSL